MTLLKDTFNSYGFNENGCILINLAKDKCDLWGIMSKNKGMHLNYFDGKECILITPPYDIKITKDFVLKNATIEGSNETCPF